MTSERTPELAQIGAELEHSIARELATSPAIPTQAAPRRRRLWSRTAVATMVVGGVVAVGGTAAAIYLTAPEVARGIPGGAVIFEGTDPSCTTQDSVVFDCTLSRPPANDGDPTFDGRKELFVDRHSRVAGGCVGQDAAGMHWTCYAGERAVEEDVIGPQLLGERTGPTRG